MASVIIAAINSIGGLYAIYSVFSFITGRLVSTFRLNDGLLNGILPTHYAHISHAPPGCHFSPGWASRHRYRLLDLHRFDIEVLAPATFKMGRHASNIFIISYFHFWSTASFRTLTIRRFHRLEAGRRLSQKASMPPSCYYFCSIFDSVILRRAFFFGYALITTPIAAISQRPATGRQRRKTDVATRTRSHGLTLLGIDAEMFQRARAFSHHARPRQASAGRTSAHWHHHLIIRRHTLDIRPSAAALRVIMLRLPIVAPGNEGMYSRRHTIKRH